MKKKISYIYIMTNPSFPDYVKIGATDKSIVERLKSLNKSECIPFAFRIWAYYKVEGSLKDIKLHDLIDKLNPNLRSKEEINGKLRKREFYLMKPEDAYNIIKQIAVINGKTKNLIKCKPSPIEAKEEKVAKNNALKARSANFSFDNCRIKKGSVITFTKDDRIKAKVIDNKNIMYKNKKYTLSGLAKILLGKKISDAGIAGTHYFKYKNQLLSDIIRNYY